MSGLKSSVHPIASGSYILSELENRAKQGNRLAYLSIVEPRAEPNLDSDSVWDIDTEWIDQIWKGVIMRSKLSLLLQDISLQIQIYQIDC
ncbi:unnamed protein product [[Candida] boidinii]|uniref:Unnamed protein product n=1 Tax=Candida boidinii TaxID=5477 RepID=A0ACB5U445_CANBO|nr:unnamed protein product [[Candida] boidinii]